MNSYRFYDVVPFIYCSFCEVIWRYYFRNTNLTNPVYRLLFSAGKTELQIEVTN